MTKNNKKGAALLIYLLIMAVFLSVLMAATYSRLLLALRRGQSATDSLVAGYAAESEVYDWIARLSGNYIRQNPFSVNETKRIGTTNITIKGTQEGNTQKITVEADRPFASTKIEAERTLENIGATSSVEILLGLDCTGSMDTVDSGDTQSRMANLKNAALSFVRKIPTDGKFKLGVYGFGTDAKWLTANGQDINLANNHTLSQIEQAINSSFGTTRQGGSLCRTIMNGTSVGTGFVFAQDHFAARRRAGVKQIEIIITDGEPNSRIPYSGCAPSVFCPAAPANEVNCNSNPFGQCVGQGEAACTQLGVGFMECAVADTNTTLPNSTNKGVRDPSIDTYAVTISTSPNGDAARILQANLGDNYFPAARAGELNSLLEKILTDIVTNRESIIIRKSVPG